MALQNRATLKTNAQTIKNETAANANTALRVGGQLEDVADSIALKVVEKTGTVLTFERCAIHNTTAAPLAGSPTFDFTGAEPTNWVLVVHQSSTAPVLPVEAVLMGGVYNANQINTLQYQYISSTRVEVRFN